MPRKTSCESAVHKAAASGTRARSLVEGLLRRWGDSNQVGVLPGAMCIASWLVDMTWAQLIA